MTSIVRRGALINCKSPTAALAGFASTIATSKLAAQEKHEVVRHLLDSLGACVAGANQPIVQAVAQLTNQLASATSEPAIPVIGSQLKTDVLTATYLMATACHALELDDGNREGSIHPGTVVVPAALAIGYLKNASGAALLAAVVAGYEVAVSIAEVLHPHASKRGFQTTPVAGTLGAAAAAGSLLGLSADAMENALGIAASSSCGIFAYLSGGGNIKKLHPAHAAREGVLAALLAEQGVIQGPRGVLETASGVFHAFGGLTGFHQPAQQTRHQLAVACSYLKPYPCCRHIHPAIDAVLEILRDQDINPVNVAAIEVGTYDTAMPHARLPWDTLNVAQLSFPYVIAMALLHGTVNLQTFSIENRNDIATAKIAAKVSVHVDEQCCKAYPVNGPARVTIKMVDGTQYSRYVAEPLGSPDRPISDEALIEKFRISLHGHLSSELANDLASWLFSAELPTVRSLVRELAR